MLIDRLYGPKTDFGQTIHAMKYREPKETFDDYCVRFARATSGDDKKQFYRILRYLREQVILPAGRQQLSVGRPYRTTAMNCFVGESIPDDTAGIFDAVKRGALVLRTGGGCGWDFSTLRPSGEPIRGLGHGAYASGPVSFMHVWHAMCGTIMSAGERRGAMMGTMRIDHPDILQFVRAKQDQTSLKHFNISVAVTDEFMEALESDGLYKLRFAGTEFSEARAVDVWAEIMQMNWDWAEPGVIFIDRINRLNPLFYCERIASTNPCGEQPLPPYGCCLLGSINLVKLLVPRSGPVLATTDGTVVGRYDLDMDMLADAVDTMVRAEDVVIDITKYPLPEHQHEEQQKRRMGLGVTGVANALEICGMPYASAEYLEAQDRILEAIRNQAYRTSCDLAREKGPFPLWDAEQYCKGEHFQRLPEDLQYQIAKYGLRNGLLTSIAPTGTISLVADNISSGIEPVHVIRGLRDIFTPTGQRQFEVNDYGAEFYGVEGRTTNEVSAEEHTRVQCRAQFWVDSSISKTCNVNGQIGGEGPGVTYPDFKAIYLDAYKGGAKSCTTYNKNGKRRGIINEMSEEAAEVDGLACRYDPETGIASCDI